MRLPRGLQPVFYGLLAAAFAWLALSIPLHFRAVSPLVLAEAAKGTPTLEDLAMDFLYAGDTGPAELILAGGSARDANLQAQLQQILAEHPDYQLSGGPAPYYEQWLERAGLTPDTVEAGSRTVLAMLLPGSHREHLFGYLRHSSNQTVQTLLATRELSGYQRFLPVYSAAGHPLDATILTTALLEQSGAWSPDMSRYIRDQAAQSSQNPASLARLENVYLALLTIGKRTNWKQLSALLQHVRSPEELNDLNAATQLAEERFPTLYAAALLSGNPASVARYILARPEEGWPVVQLATGMGQGALASMSAFDRPLYEAPAFMHALPLEPGQAFMRGFSESQPQFALGLKALLLIIGGFACALAVETFIRLFTRPLPINRGKAVHAFHLVSAMTLAGFLWIATEPKLLQFDPNEAGSLRLQFAQIVPSAPFNETDSESTMIDQATILVLILFFVLQVLIFTFSMLKINEIRHYPGSAPLKLRLLDNEENLFDLGLYVGLGGTVSSLVFIVLEFVDASLMAAYTSSLFGIVFVAILKIFFLRPFRRRLILEATDSRPATSLAPGLSD